MIQDRLYIPAHDELIYHYCPPEAFLHIVESRVIWAGASHVLNDASERNWGYSVFQEALSGLERRTGADFIKVLKHDVDVAYLYSIQMMSSFSLAPNVLSQWRAYADDARGFAIGFSKALMQLPAKRGAPRP